MRTKKIIFLLLLLVFILLTSGCLEGLFNQKPIIGSTPGTTAKVGLEYTYEIIATDPDGDTLTYALVEKPDGMTINESTDVVSWTPGEDQIGENQVEIEVSDGKKSVFQSFTINVEEPLLSSIVVVPSTMSIYIGDSKPITSITAYYDNETSSSIKLSSASYSSDNTDVATVHADTGVVTGVSVGTATITVSYTEGDITKIDTISVTVKEPPILTSISVLPPFMSIYIGSEYSLIITSITANYEDGTTASIELNDSNVHYISEDPNIAIVSNDGVITGIAVGNIEIIVTYTEGVITVMDTVNVNVEQKP